MTSVYPGKVPPAALLPDRPSSPVPAACYCAVPAHQPSVSSTISLSSFSPQDLCTHHSPYLGSSVFQPMSGLSLSSRSHFKYHFSERSAMSTCIRKSSAPLFITHCPLNAGFAWRGHACIFLRVTRCVFSAPSPWAPRECVLTSECFPRVVHFF